MTKYVTRMMLGLVASLSAVVVAVLVGAAGAGVEAVAAEEEGDIPKVVQPAPEGGGETSTEEPPAPMPDLDRSDIIHVTGGPDYRYVTVTRQRDTLFRYCLRAARYKPYVQQFPSPSGVEVLADAPPDHPHHHGLMFAVGVDDVDFWVENETPGRQVLRNINEDVYEDKGRYSVTHVLDWFSGDNRTFLARETRTIILGADLIPNARTLVWKTDLELPPDRKEIKLWGRHYFGLGMRMAEAMDKNGTFLAEGGSEGQVVRGDERLRPGKWCAYVASAGDKQVTVAMFDHPLNRRRTLWFTMAKPFAYMAASLNLHQKPVTLKQGDKLSLLYGIVVWDGAQPAETIQEMYEGWLKAVILDKDV